MFRPRVIPCLLLNGKDLVKTVEFGNPNYLGDPINAVKIFNDLEADELVFLDISATKENREIPLEVVKKIGDEAFMPFAVGGGIKSLDYARKVINAGAEKVILNTSALENPEIVKEISETLGSQSVIVSLDVKKKDEGSYALFSRSGTKEISGDVLEVARKFEKLGAGEIIINSITNDGRMEGYDLELVKKVSEAVNLPVVALGGAGEFEDLKKAIDYGAHAVAAGSLFVYSGRNKGILINYPDREELEEIFS